MEEYIERGAFQSDFNDETGSLERFRSSTSGSNQPKANSSGGFECNICLDPVQDPVVTFCGHLYCWPCIYRWMYFNDEDPDHQQSKCPVCKTEVSQKTLVPLYGRGESSDHSKAEDHDTLIPQRPTTPQRGSMPTQSNYHAYPEHNPVYARSPQFDYRMAYPRLGTGGSSTRLADPMIGMLGEMVYAQIFGNSEATLYAYPSSYHLAARHSPRLRRHITQADTSLSRVCFFLCCCVILCLLLF